MNEFEHLQIEEDIYRYFKGFADYDEICPSARVIVDEILRSEDGLWEN